MKLGATLITGATLLSMALVVGCTASVGGGTGDVVELGDEVTEVGDPEPEESDRSIFASYSLPVPGSVKVCNVYVGLNFRSGPSTSYQILKVLPGGKLAKTVKRSGNWYRLNVSGTYGWSYGKYLCRVTSGTTSIATTSSGSYGISRDGIINTAKAWVGFSYWWGGAAFPEPWKNMSSYSKGKCYSATYSGHSGKWGADCSGYVAKVWQLPPAMSFTANRHPYSTYHFYHQRNYWSAISRDSTRRADALVYRTSSKGHVIVYEKGDAWGQAWTYEARNCSSGVVHNLRSISSSYRTRRRNGV